MAKSGPIISITKIIKKVPNNWFIFLVKLERCPSHFPIDMIPKTGIPTPVTKKPKREKIQSFPDKCPKVGGNIKFPAPKNIANKAKPITIISVVFLLINCSHP